MLTRRGRSPASSRWSPATVSAPVSGSSEHFRGWGFEPSLSPTTATLPGTYLVSSTYTYKCLNSNVTRSSVESFQITNYNNSMLNSCKLLLKLIFLNFLHYIIWLFWPNVKMQFALVSRDILFLNFNINAADKAVLGKPSIKKNIFLLTFVNKKMFFFNEGFP